MEENKNAPMPETQEQSEHTFDDFTDTQIKLLGEWNKKKTSRFCSKKTIEQVRKNVETINGYINLYYGRF